MSIVKKVVRTKPKTNEKAKELLEEFLEAKNYGIFSNLSMHRSYSIKPLKDDKKTSSYTIEEIINCNLDMISSEDKFLEFITYCLKKSENDVAISQAIKKTPRVNHYNYDHHVDQIINTLIPFKKTLFEYVARPSFLQSSYKQIPKIFTAIDDQERRIVIFESLINTKTFQNIDSQKEIYNFAQEFLKQPEKFDQYFNRIKKIHENQNVVDNNEINSVVSLGFNIDKLIGANIETELSSETIINNIKRITKNIETQFGTDLEISTTLMDYNSKTKQYQLHIICKEGNAPINSYIFSELINEISRKSNYKEIEDFNNNLSLFMKEQKAIYMNNKLNQSLNSNVQQHPRKNKI